MVQDILEQPLGVTCLNKTRHWTHTRPDEFSPHLHNVLTVR